MMKGKARSHMSSARVWTVEIVFTAEGEATLVRE